MLDLVLLVSMHTWEIKMWVFWRKHKAVGSSSCIWNPGLKKKGLAAIKTLPCQWSYLEQIRSSQKMLTDSRSTTNWLIGLHQLTWLEFIPLFQRRKKIRVTSFQEERIKVWLSSKNRDCSVYRCKIRQSLHYLFARISEKRWSRFRTRTKLSSGLSFSVVLRTQRLDILLCNNHSEGRCLPAWRLLSFQKSSLKRQSLSLSEESSNAGCHLGRG